jgi:hypothetical protein
MGVKIKLDIVLITYLLVLTCTCTCWLTRNGPGRAAQRVSVEGVVHTLHLTFSFSLFRASHQSSSVFCIAISSLFSLRAKHLSHFDQYSV